MTGAPERTKTIGYGGKTIGYGGTRTMSDDLERCVWPLGDCSMQTHIEALEAKLGEKTALHALSGGQAMTDLELWESDGLEMGWVMPQAAWWKRLPVIRHIRCAYHVILVRNHNAFWLSIGLVSTGYDNWVLYGIRIGKERPL